MLFLWFIGTVSNPFFDRFGSYCGAVSGSEILLKPFQTLSKTLQETRSAQEPLWPGSATARSFGRPLSALRALLAALGTLGAGPGYRDGSSHRRAPRDLYVRGTPKSPSPPAEGRSDSYNHARFFV